MWTPLVLKEQLRQSTTLQCESEPTLLFYFNGLEGARSGMWCVGRFDQVTCIWV